MTYMKSRSTQFGARENTASSRQHAPRRAVDSLPPSSHTLLRSPRHRESPPSLPSCTNKEGDSLITKPPDAATGGERGESAEALTISATATAANKLRHVFEPLIGCEEAAKLLGNIHVKTLQRYARQGTLPGYRVAGHWYFRASELDSWLRSRINSSCHACRSN